jgi:hypothetical protein
MQTCFLKLFSLFRIQNFFYPGCIIYSLSTVKCYKTDEYFAHRETTPPTRYTVKRRGVWRAAYILGWRQTICVYPNIPAQSLYRSCYVTADKLVLSYLSLRLVPQWWPWPGVPFVLYTVLLYTHTDMSEPTSVGRSLFCLCKWHFSFQFYNVHFFSYNLASAFRSLRNLQTFCFGSSCWELAIATTALNFEHVFCYSYFCPLSLRSF